MPATILIVDDNEVSLGLVQYLLERRHHRVLAATSGGTAVQTAIEEHPDLVLMDLEMPGLNGYQARERIKSEPGLGETVVVALTAFAMVGDREKTLAAGFEGFLTKPIAPETFVEQVERFLPPSLRSAGPSAPPEAEEVEGGERPAPPEARETVLIVDNSPVNLDVWRSTLEPLGFTVMAARDGREAEGAIREVRPDIVLTDLHMPVASGLDLLRALKTDPELAQIPVIVASSTTPTQADSAEILALGAARYVPRPAEPHELLAAVEEVLAERKEP